MIKEIFAKNKYKILFTYFILIFEFSTFALIPYWLGKAIDEVIVKDFTSFYHYLYLILFGLAVGVSRRVYDTIVFLTIWANNVTSAVGDLKSRNVTQTKIISRYRLLSTYSDFFEHTIPSSISSFVEIIIALVMVFFAVSTNVFLIILTFFTISIVIYYVVSCYSQPLETAIQHLREKIDSEIIENDADIEKYVHELKNKEIILSNLNAFAWGIQDLLNIAAEVVAITSIVETMTAGTLMATITYIYKLFVYTGCFSELFFQIKRIDVIDSFINEK